MKHPQNVINLIIDTLLNLFKDKFNTGTKKSLHSPRRSWRRVSIFFVLILIRFASLIGQIDTSVNHVEDALEKEKDTETGVEDIVQAYVESRAEEGDFDFNTLIDRYEYFRSHKINLNQLDELDDFILLRPFQIASLKEYIQQYGKLISYYELQVVPGFDVQTIKGILPLISLDAGFEQYNITLMDMMRLSDHILFARWGRYLENATGYLPSNRTGVPPYLGSPSRVYFRYHQTFENHLSLGITGEKDPGEEFFSGSNNKGFDFLSLHAYIRKLNKQFESIALGDYSISFGQGLIIHSGFGIGKSPWATNIRKGDRTIKPYTSSNESNFFRGIATEIKLRDKLHLTLMGSIRRKDGNILQDSLKREAQFSSFEESGYHRTLGELDDKNRIRETVLGASLKYLMSRGHIALNHLSSWFDKDYHKANTAYNQFAFDGNKLAQTSIDHAYRVRNFNFFGEYALAAPGTYGWMEGMQWPVNKNMELAILYRSLDKGYPAIYSNAFSENTFAANEKGLYIGAELRPGVHWKIAGYWDLWSHPWLQYNSQGPSSGNEQFVRVSYTIKRTLEIYLQFRNKTQEQNLTVDLPLKPLASENKHSIRFNLEYHWNKSWDTRTRFEANAYNKILSAQSKGWMVYQDFLFKALSSPFSFSTRIAYFNTHDYNSGIYAYENDLLYNFYVPVYYHTGWRYYLNLRYGGIRNLTFEGRYAMTYLADQDTIGSGNDLINGNKRTEIKLQVRYKF